MKCVDFPMEDIYEIDIKELSDLADFYIDKSIVATGMNKVAPAFEDQVFWARNYPELLFCESWQRKTDYYDDVKMYVRLLGSTTITDIQNSKDVHRLFNQTDDARALSGKMTFQEILDLYGMERATPTTLKRKRDMRVKEQNLLL